MTDDLVHKPSSINQRTLDWLLLSLVPGVSSNTLLKLQRVYPEPEDILRLFKTGEWRHLPLTKVAKEWSIQYAKKLDSVLSQQLKRTESWLTEGGAILDWQSPEYPELLNQIYDPPVLLYLQGHAKYLSSTKNLAMVGSRKASSLGLDLAEQFAALLVEHGWQVVSGMALGIDGAAHKGALEAYQHCEQIGSTLAVVATGLDQIYPKSHKALQSHIIETGCLISEYPLGTLPKANHFPRRNRIISGLSQGVLVVEASLKSGSLVTARCALEQNRDVFALPGALNNPQVTGCHHLIQQGAKLVTCLDDVLEELGHSASQTKFSTSASTLPSKHSAHSQTQDLFQGSKDQSPKERSNDPVLAAIGPAGATADEIIISTGLPWQELSQKLLMLEMSGQIQSTQGGYQLTSS